MTLCKSEQKSSMSILCSQLQLQFFIVSSQHIQENRTSVSPFDIRCLGSLTSLDYKSDLLNDQ